MQNESGEHRLDNQNGTAEDKIPPDCLLLIQKSRVMTLSTCGSGVWAAPVYFIFKRGAFYFFSSPDARHIREGAGQPAAASLFQDAHDPGLLKGLQMSGRIQACRPGKASAAVALAYAGRFGIQAGPGNLLNFFLTRFHSALYRFIPERAYYMDNQKGIGNRTRIQL